MTNHPGTPPTSARCPLCGIPEDRQTEEKQHSCQPTPQLFTLLDYHLGGDPATAPARQAIARARHRLHTALQEAGLDPNDARPYATADNAPATACAPSSTPL